MLIPFISILKLLALGSIKLIFLLLGTAFFPIFALRFILGGATSMLLPTLEWLEQNNKLDSSRHTAIVEDLQAMTRIDFTRAEARLLLQKLIRKMLRNALQSIKGSFVRVRKFFSALLP